MHLNFLSGGWKNKQSRNAKIFGGIEFRLDVVQYTQGAVRVLN